MSAPTKNDVKLSEAQTWIGQALDLLDQAHANLKDLGLHNEEFRDRVGRRVDASETLTTLTVLYNAVKKLHFCYAPDCGEPATRVCDACDAYACNEHSAHFDADRCSCGETTMCDACRLGEGD